MRAKNFATSIGARSKSDEAFSTNKLETGSLFDKKMENSFFQNDLASLALTQTKT